MSSSSENPNADKLSQEIPSTWPGRQLLEGLNTWRVFRENGGIRDQLHLDSVLRGTDREQRDLEADYDE